MLSRIIAILFVYLLMTNLSEAFELFGITFVGEEAENSEDHIVDPFPYEVDLKVSGDDDDLHEQLELASTLVQQQDTIPSGMTSLLSRAKGDQERLVAILFQTGRYGGLVDIQFAGHALDSSELTREMLENVDKPIDVTINVDPGKVFLFRKVGISGIEQSDLTGSLEQFGLIPGESAEAAKILSAETQIIEYLNNHGFPFAEISTRSVVADHAVDAVDVFLTIDDGGKRYFGIETVEGNDKVETEFILELVDIPYGETYSAKLVKEAERRLRSLDVFNRARIHTTHNLEFETNIPLTISVEEKKSRYIGANLSVSSVDGLTTSMYNGYRNLLGGAERLRFTVTGAGIGRGEIFGLDYGLAANFVNPAFFDTNTDFLFNTGFHVETTKTYNSEVLTVSPGLVHRFSEILTGNANLNFESTTVKDDLGTRDFVLIGVPLQLSLDSRNVALNPSTGNTSRLSFEPVYEGENGHTFGMFEAEGTTYAPLDESNRLVFASKFVAGSIFGTETQNIPANRRFLLGGGGSIRGYEYRGIGLNTGSGVVSGGRSKLELSNELRYQFSDSFGIVPFLDVGSVFDTALPDFSEKLYSGVGIGLRYFTGFGPIRADWAVPLNRDDDISSFAFYIGFGQVY